jgi:2-oxoglutarate dehydrogenase E1 component
MTDKFSYIGTSDVSAIESLFEQYLKDENSVDVSWRDFFKGFEFANANYNAEAGSTNVPENIGKEFKVISLITGYRQRGHLFTKTNPVRQRRTYQPTLDLENFGLTDKDLDTVFQAGNEIGIGPASLKAIIAHLEQTYCGSIGAEYLFMREPKVVKWLQERMEKSKNTPSFTLDEKRGILKKLTQAVVFENYLHTKFVGQKRFSLEGGEAVIPGIHTLIQHGCELGIEDYIIGMAHRGRLNVLTNIMNKNYTDVFTEFEGRPSADSLFDGDVKYHMGYSSDQLSETCKKVHISLTPNPSHLETVNPVVEGIARAKIDNLYKGDHSKVCPILLHGDGAVAGQGIVYEVLQMSQLEGYKTGGTVHFVINNQVGFTTNFWDARSSTYCTDIAKVVLSPVFHVNGDDVEALCFVAELAMEFRQTFHRDVFIDVLCYRKYGHNEGDEPRFTQPLLYKAIAAHPGPKDIYIKKLEEEGSELVAEVKEIEKAFRAELDEDLVEAKKSETAKVTSFLEGNWKGIKMATDKDFETSPETSIDEKTFLEMAKGITELPKDRKFFNKIQKVFDDRKAMIVNDKYDWAMGELMAYASVMKEGHHVRFSGQDVERGTFSHRHAVVTVEDSEEEYTPLNNIGAKGELRIYNSLLSEYGVLGFEYGYAFASPNILTIWEAQFGDFFNGAQIIIDQYLAPAESKWRRMNGLVLLLPHGYEGQGPEHSSARMERFLQMCAHNNIYVINATTPAQQFHALRRQLKDDFRKPLICFTPKKLLRYPACISKLSDFTKGGFKEILDDTSADAKKVTRLAFCSGKVYYDLIERREKENMNDIAFIRVEQLYPFPHKQIDAILKKYNNAKDLMWIQEETENAGAWRYIDHAVRSLNLKYIGREDSASPATGFAKRHNEESEQIMQKIFSKVLAKQNIK